MCEYCNTGSCCENIPLEILIDGKHQYFELDLFYDLDRDNTTLRIDGTHTDIRVKINYCPMCGNKLT